MLTKFELLGIHGVTPDYFGRRLDETSLNPLNLRQSEVSPSEVRACLEYHGVDYSPRVVVHANLKGGTGKTTSTVTGAVRAADYGFRTCILDLDSQGSASLALDLIPGDDDPVFVDVWQRPNENIPEALKTHANGISILPSSLENSLLDVQLVNPNAQKNAVRGVCDAVIESGFDLIMIDCPPSLGTAVISSICAADTIVIPTNSDQFSLKGIELTMQEIKAICDTFGLSTPSIKVLHTQFDRRIGLTHEAFEFLSKRYPDQLIALPIRTSSEYAKRFRNHQTVFSSHRKSVARDDYDSYVRELLSLALPDPWPVSARTEESGV